MPVRLARLTAALAVAVAALGAAGPLRAQDDAATLRDRIEERFAARVQQELGLTDDQTRKLREVSGAFAQRRRAMEQEERELKRTLAGELRPGVAADAATVDRATQRLMELKVAYAKTYQDELREWGFLTPVQRAQLVMMRERLFETLQRARQERLRQGGALARPRPAP